MVSLCQYKLKNTTFLTLRVFGLQYQFVFDKYETIETIQLLYTTNIIRSVVFQLKLAPTSKVAPESKLNQQTK